MPFSNLSNSMFSSGSSNKKKSGPKTGSSFGAMYNNRGGGTVFGGLPGKNNGSKPYMPGVINDLPNLMGGLAPTQQSPNPFDLEQAEEEQRRREQEMMSSLPPMQRPAPSSSPVPIDGPQDPNAQRRGIEEAERIARETQARDAELRGAAPSQPALPSGPEFRQMSVADRQRAVRAELDAMRNNRGSGAVNNDWRSRMDPDGDGVGQTEDGSVIYGLNNGQLPQGRYGLSGINSGPSPSTNPGVAESIPAPSAPAPAAQSNGGSSNNGRPAYDGEGWYEDQLYDWDPAAYVDGHSDLAREYNYLRTQRPFGNDRVPRSYDLDGDGVLDKGEYGQYHRDRYGETEGRRLNFGEALYPEPSTSPPPQQRVEDREQESRNEEERLREERENRENELEQRRRELEELERGNQPPAPAPDPAPDPGADPAPAPGDNPDRPPNPYNDVITDLRNEQEAARQALEEQRAADLERDNQFQEEIRQLLEGRYDDLDSENAGRFDEFEGYLDELRAQYDEGMNSLEDGYNANFEEIAARLDELSNQGPTAEELTLAIQQAQNENARIAANAELEIEMLRIEEERAREERNWERQRQLEQERLDREEAERQRLRAEEEREAQLKAEAAQAKAREDERMRIERDGDSFYAEAQDLMRDIRRSRNITDPYAEDGYYTLQQRRDALLDSINNYDTDLEQGDPSELGRFSRITDALTGFDNAFEQLASRRESQIGDISSQAQDLLARLEETPLYETQAMDEIRSEIDNLTADLDDFGFYGTDSALEDLRTASEALSTRRDELREKRREFAEKASALNEELGDRAFYTMDELTGETDDLEAQRIEAEKYGAETALQFFDLLESRLEREEARLNRDAEIVRQREEAERQDFLDQGENYANPFSGFAYGQSEIFNDMAPQDYLAYILSQNPERRFRNADGESSVAPTAFSRLLESA